MKLRKKIGITILTLAFATICGIGAMWAAGYFQSSTDFPEDTIENDKVAGSQSVDMISDRANQPRETALNDSEENMDRKLIDLEDYSETPADNGRPYYVKVNRRQNVVTIYALDDNGYYTRPVRAMVCSVGKDDGTPTGTFRTSDKHEWCALVGGVYGQYAYRISGAIMFHSVPYYSMNKDDLETEEYNKLGEAASLGCIRLSVLDAKWIYDNCPAGTIVTIYDSDYIGPLGKPVGEILDIEDERSSWDPTDPDKENPWNNGKPRILGGGERVVERGHAYQSVCGVLALDGEGNDITAQVKLEGRIDIMVAGEYPVTYSVQDARGNVVQLESVIQVKDTIAPEITLNEETITFNRIEASEANSVAAIMKYITISDSGDELGPEALTLDISNLVGKSSGKYSITAFATDASGNRSNLQKFVVYLDRVAPVILEPEQKEFIVTSDSDLESQLLEAIRVEDNYSGIAQVQVSWVQEHTGSYTVLVTARDMYGNVRSEFLRDFIISYESGE